MGTAQKAGMIWRCPRCRGALQVGGGGLRCASCGSHYESVGGIPDLRLPGAIWIDAEADRDQARRLLAETAGLSVEDLVRHVFRSRPDWGEAQIELRTRQIMEAPCRLRKEVMGWLKPSLADRSPFLDLGCGAGTLLAAAAAEGWHGIGIDVSMVWLVVAQRLIREWGGEPVLAAGLAEALPLAENAVASVVSLDVVEHVGDQERYLKEIDRVTAPGGCVALSTPNRYSLTSEPHVFVWGVGWLPRCWQKAYVKWRSGKSYDFCRLLSTREAGRLLRRYTGFRFDIQVPPVPEEEIAHFPTIRAALARLYNQLVPLSWTRSLFLIIGPFFRVVGKKA